jgi:DNA-binding response OmpR family regulator
MIAACDIPTVMVVDPCWDNSGWPIDSEPILSAQLYVHSTAENALRAASGADVGLWVIAVDLPDATGFELCREIRSHAMRPTVFLLDTAYSPEHELRARQAGASCYLTCPIDAEVIAAGLRSVDSAKLAIKRFPTSTSVIATAGRPD